MFYVKIFHVLDVTAVITIPCLAEISLYFPALEEKETKPLHKAA